MVEHGRAAAAAADLNKLAAANSVIDSNYGSDDEVATVSCGTTAGDVVLEFHRHWSPAGYDRAVALFERGFYDRSHFFRTVPNFLVQFGISYSHDAALQKLARTPIPDDPQLEPAIPFVEGTISYAGSGPNSRNSQLFMSLRDDGGSFGTQLWETPIGKVVEGMDHVRNFYSGYGDMPPWGKGPVQGKIHAEGTAYMEENFPKTDRFIECKVEREGGKHTAAAAAADQHQQPHDHRQVHDAHHEQHHPHNIRALQGSHRSHRSRKDHQPHQQHQQQQHHIPPDEPQHVSGELHHQHSVHFNAAPNEEGLTKLSWELLGSCLVLFLGVFVLWLRFALNSPKKIRKTS